MKLELKHLAPYLPYGLKIQVDDDRREWNDETLTGLDAQLNSCDTKEGNYWNIDGVKPILRPLTDLTKEIETTEGKLFPCDYWNNHTDSIHYNENLCTYAKHNYYDGYLPYHIMEKLFEWHFDVFELIDKGLALDINTIKG